MMAEEGKGKGMAKRMEITSDKGREGRLEG